MFRQLDGDVCSSHDCKPCNCLDLAYDTVSSISRMWQKEVVNKC